MKLLGPRGLALAALALPLAACSGAGTGPAAADGRTEVLAALYPLEYVAEQVGGDHVAVSPVTPAGVDPHDLELAPAAVARLDGATVVYLSGFQAALDDALAVTSPAHALDVSDAAGVHTEGDGHPDETTDDHGHEDGPGTGDHAGHSHADGDPHFWLDPVRLADVATAVADELAAVDPGNADDYSANAERLGAELTALDHELAAGLDQCETRTIVVAHEAYGYLAEAYGLEQVGISGLDPESEPSPARLAQIGKVVDEKDVTTIFTENLVNPAVAETLAADLGVDVAVLDPLETQVDPSRDYLDVMRTNLDALTTSLRCS
jgi:zinc transport system substrate-binding protein